MPIMLEKLRGISLGPEALRGAICFRAMLTSGFVKSSINGELMSSITTWRVHYKAWSILVG